MSSALIGRDRRGASVKDVFPAFFHYFFGRAKLTDPTEVSAGEGPSGGVVTIDSALQLSAAWACIRLLSETIATLPCNVYERGQDGDRKSASAHPLYDLLHNQPNADMSAVSFWQAYITSMLTHGVGYGEKILEGSRLVAIDFLNPTRVTRRVLPSGAVQYTYIDGHGDSRVIREDAMWATPAFSLDGRCGLSPIRYGALILGGALAADEASSAMFANGMRPAGVLNTDKVLTPKQRDDMRANVIAKLSGTAKSGNTLLLEAGMKYQALTMPPEDAQLLQTRSFGIEEICRWYGVPPIMVGHSEKVTAWGTGIEQIVIGFLTFSLRPWLARLEQSIRRSLLAPAERPKFFAEFAVEGLLRADSAARSAFYSQMAQNGVMSRNEIRRLENLPRVEGGDVITVQSNLIDINRLGALSADDATAVRSALMQWLQTGNERT